MTGSAEQPPTGNGVVVHQPGPVLPTTGVDAGFTGGALVVGALSVALGAVILRKVRRQERHR